MIVIDNKKLFQSYCVKYDIGSYFTNWDALIKKLVRYNKGEIVTLYGEKSDKLFFLVKGTIRFCCITDNYEEYFFFDATDEGFFGEVEYVLNIPLITQAEAIDECDCIIIPIKANRHLLDTDLKFQIFITKVLASKYNDMRNLSMNKESYTLDVRLAKYLITYKNDDYITNLTQIAKILKCSYRHLLRILKKFTRNGWIERLPQKGKYKIVDREALEKLVYEFK